MMNKILQKIVSWYIHRNMGHDRYSNRTFIFSAINHAAKQQFTEDNQPSLRHALQRWLIETE